jgi:hypothetical protein
MSNKKNEQKIIIDEVEYLLDDLSETSKAQIASINFVNETIGQLQNEWAVCDTARIGYTKALKHEVSQSNKA